ncbi:MAG: LytR/AlgR family response regulator transcription factor [Bacteroidota bacterium]
MIKAVIIDDEEMAREIIADYLEEFEEIEVVAQCEDGFSGLKTIQDKNPDLVFLDVQMPKLTGFEMLEILDEKPAIIFTTAYDQYAIQAFEQNAVDYLLKPFPRDRFNAAVEKAISRIRKGPDRPEKQKVREHLDKGEQYINRVVVKLRKEIRIIAVNQINYLEAQDDYVMIYTGKEKFLKQKTMKYFENHLDPREFIRIHRSYITRTDRIGKIEPYEKGSFVVVLKDETSLPVSKSGFAKLKSVLDL